MKSITKLNCVDIADGIVTVPPYGQIRTTTAAIPVRYRIDKDSTTVLLSISDFWFTAADLKELRKVLKRLEAAVS